MILNVYAPGFCVLNYTQSLKDSDNIQIHFDDDGRDKKKWKKPKNRI